MGLRETGRNRRGRRVTVQGFDRPFVHVTGGLLGRVGMGRDPRGNGGATCKTARINLCGVANRTCHPTGIMPVLELTLKDVGVGKTQAATPTRAPTRRADLKDD
jgi:hypothetical protein